MNCLFVQDSLFVAVDKPGQLKVSSVLTLNKLDLLLVVVRPPTVGQVGTLFAMAELELLFLAWFLLCKMPDLPIETDELDLVIWGLSALALILFSLIKTGELVLDTEPKRNLDEHEEKLANSSLSVSSIRAESTSFLLE